jgi:hypothetical protein
MSTPGSGTPRPSLGFAPRWAMPDGLDPALIHDAPRWAPRLFQRLDALEAELRSDRAIAEKAGVDHKTVADVREEVGGEIPHHAKRVGLDDDAILAELRTLRGAIEAIGDDVAMLLASQRLDRSEQDFARRLAAALRPIVRGAEFGASDVLDTTAVSALVAGHSAASLAWIFRRSPQYFARVGRDNTGVLWRLVA